MPSNILAQRGGWEVWGGVPVVGTSPVVAGAGARRGSRQEGGEGRQVGGRKWREQGEPESPWSVWLPVLARDLAAWLVETHSWLPDQAQLSLPPPCHRTLHLQT